MKHSGFLIVGANGEMRVTKRLLSNSVRSDQVAFRVVVNVPDGWGKVRGIVEFAMPEPPSQASIETSAASSPSDAAGGENVTGPSSVSEGGLDVSTSSSPAPRSNPSQQER